MIVRKPLTVEDLETIKRGVDSGKSMAEIARDIGRVQSIVKRIRDQIKSGKFLQRLAEIQEREVQKAKNDKSNGVVKSSNAKNLSTEQRRKRITALRDQGIGLSDIAKKLGMPAGSVSYYYYSKPKKSAGQSSRNNTTEKITALKQQGLTLGQIAERVGLSHNSVHYHLYTKAKTGKEHTNGNGTSSANANGDAAINRNILIGIAFAETERFIGLLSERLGVTAEVLKPRLSELLGHSPLR
jgi:AcrR family transcriptional regulator